MQESSERDLVKNQRSFLDVILSVKDTFKIFTSKWTEAIKNLTEKPAQANLCPTSKSEQGSLGHG